MGPGAVTDPSTVLRREVVLVFGIRVSGDWPPEGYRPGPVSLYWPRRADPVRSTADSRIEYTHESLGPLLWDSSVRCYREFPQENPESPGPMPPSPSGLLLEAVELIRLDAHARSSLSEMWCDAAADGVAVFHGRMPARVAPTDMIELLRNCADLDPRHGGGAYRAWTNRMLPPGCEVARDQREAVYLCLITSRTGLPPLDERSAGRGLDPPDQWLLHLYEASRKPAGGSLDAKRLPLVGGLSGVMGLRGLVVVGTEPDVVRPGYDVSYYAGSSYQQRTLYTDAFVLARLQELLIDALDAEVELAARSTPDRRRIFRLERDLLVFRRTYLGASFGRSEKPKAILRRWQTQADTHARVQNLREDLTELSRQVQTFESENTNAILGLIAAIALPLATGLAIWAGLPDAGAAALWWTLLPVVITTLVLILAVRGLRRLILDAFGRRHRGR
ncbi:hypothetical protein G6W48_12900 [Streptomyces sp. CAI-24]|nr:hypothetical protein [Streptomyces sp. CAI-24]